MNYTTPIFIYNDTLMALNLRVHDYVIRHKKCGRSDIAKALEIPANRVSAILNDLSKQGKVRRVRSNENAAEWVWEPGAAADYEPKEITIHGNMIQRTVDTWEPERRRDPLTAALFGMSNVDRRK